MSRFTLKAAAVSALLATTALTAAHAATTGPNPSYRTQPQMLTTADEALTAVTRAHAARLALFDNDIATAKARLAEAQTDFLTAEKSFNDLTIGDTEQPEDAAKYLPFDMSMSLTEEFTPTQEQSDVVKKASGMIRSGSSDDAVELLRAADVEVDVTAALLPVADVTTQLEKAQDFVDQGLYYEANLALKQIEDSVIVRTFSIDAIPEQGQTVQASADAPAQTPPAASPSAQTATN